MTRRFLSRKLIAASLLSLAAGGVLAGRLTAGELSLSPVGRGDGFPMMGRLLRHLDLSADQKARVREVFQAHSAELQAQRDAHRAARRALADAIAAEPFNESAIRARAADVGRVEGDGAVLFSRIRSEISPLLTTEQRGKLKEMREKVRERKGGRGL